MSPAGFALGIDFGTSSTVALLRWPDGRVKPLMFDSSPLLPSAVFGAPDGSFEVGADALHRGRFAPACLERNPKRRGGGGAGLLGGSEVAGADPFAAGGRPGAPRPAKRTRAGRPPRGAGAQPARGWPAAGRKRLLLGDAVRAGKEMLPRTSSITLRPPLLDTDVPLSRTEFDEIARPLVERTVRTTAGLVRHAGVPAERIAGLFLVGGSSRIPLAASALHRAFGIAPIVTEQPELVVAEGALHWASGQVPAQ